MQPVQHTPCAAARWQKEMDLGLDFACPAAGRCPKPTLLRRISAERACAATRVLLEKPCLMCIPKGRVSSLFTRPLQAQFPISTTKFGLAIVYIYFSFHDFLWAGPKASP
jgi:hypothetical protein